MKTTRTTLLSTLIVLPALLVARPKPPVAPVIPTAPMPEAAAVSAKSAVIVDASTGRVLWGKDPDKQMYPASTTKIMTAMLLIEHCTPDEVITAPQDIKTVGESSMHLQPGEQVSMRNMLWAILLRSANDGCYATAIHIAGSVPAFAKMMNDRAQLIGCTHTHFANPNGLHDPKHWTSAHDLAMMACEAFKLPLFAETVKTPKHQIARSMNEKDTWMVSKNHLLIKDKTEDGVKTGYTVPAGHTYVGSATRNGFRLVTALMKSDHWELDHEAMLAWAFKTYEHVTVAKRGDVPANATISGAPAGPLPVALATDVVDCVPKGQSSKLVATFEPASLNAPIQSGQTVGTEIYSDGTGYTVRVPVVATAEVSKLVVAGHTPGKSPSYFLIASGLCVGVLFIRSRTRRSKFYGKSSSNKGNFSLFS